MQDLFLQSSINRFKEYKQLAEKAFGQLSDEDFLFEPAPDVNSIAVIIQHMHGNMLSRWTNFLVEDGEKEWRNRDTEFNVQPYSRTKLLELWNEGWQVLFQALQPLSSDDLSKTITIRTQPLTVTDAIVRQLMHYSYHVGQIVYLAKMIKKEQWQSLSIPKGKSADYNQTLSVKK